VTLTPAFLEPDVVLFLHDQSIREFGGYYGVRDEALLSSALDRPRNKFGYEEHTDLIVLGAAYAFGIAKNHAFLDGNKRTGWASCVLFLQINGIALKVPAAAVVEYVVALATGGLGEAEFADWLRKFTARREVRE
jgi:death on curing protein